MPQLDITADVSGLDKASNNFEAVLRKMDDRVKDVTSTLNKYNDEGERTRSVVKGVTKDNQTFTATFGTQTEKIKDANGKVIGLVKSYGLLDIAYKQVARADEAAALARKKQLALMREEEAAAKRLAKLEADLAQERKNRFAASLANKVGQLRTDIRGGGGGGGIGGPTRDDNEQAGFFERNLQRVGNQLKYFVTYRAFQAISDGIREGVTEANKLQIQLSLIRTITQDSQQTFRQYQEQVRAVSDQSGFDINETAKAFYEAASNQLAKGAALKPLIAQTTEFARIVGSDLPDSVNLLSSTINAYGLSTEHTEDILASFFKTIDEGRIVVNEIGGTIGRAFVLADNLGVSFKEVESILAITTQKGFTTADAMTLITNLLVKLEKPTEATSALFKELGVSSGAAAIQTFGFTGIIRKMIDLVNSGKVDVGAFFDEIRGRKQFGVFQQSIDEIDRFTSKLENTNQIIKEYNAARAIRSESPADYLNKEINKISNAFKVDVGTKILEFSANLFKVVDGAKGVGDAFRFASPYVEAAGVALGGYGVVAGTIIGANRLLGLSFLQTASSAIALKNAIPFVALSALGYAVGSELFKGRTANVPGVDTDKLNSSLVEIEKFRLKQAQLSDNVDKPTAQRNLELIKDTYKDIGKFIADAIVKNDGFVSSTARLGKQSQENLKNAYEVFRKITDDNLQGIRSKITDINGETERAARNQLKFSRGLEELLFQTKLQYANNDFNDQFGNPQKIAVREAQIRRLKERADADFRSGNTERINEARQLYDTIASLEKDNFDDRVEQQKKLAEFNGYTGVLFVDPTPLERKLLALKEEKARQEAIATKELAKQRDILKQQEAIEEKRFKDLDTSFKRLDAIQLASDTGKINPEFLTGGQLDRKKAIADFDVAAQFLRNAVGNDANARIAIEDAIANRRRAFVAEIGALERDQQLKTQQQLQINAESNLKKRLEDNKKEQKANSERINALDQEFQNKPNLLRAFAAPLKDRPALAEEAERQIAGFESSFKQGKLTPEQSVGVFRTLLKDILKAGGRPDVLGVGAEESTTAFKAQVEEYNKARLQSIELATRYNAELEVFKADTQFKFGLLKDQFPELGKSADIATDAIKRLVEQLNRLNLENKGAMAEGEIGAAYAAFGGMAGAFPGQPRGVDRYPIWAARGEYIVNAESTRRFLPMLEAINNRRAAYMANGGVVGGDTSIGDITVNVTGGQTNAETGQYLAQAIRRLTRRGQLKR